MIAIVPSTLGLVAEYYKTYGVDLSWAGDISFAPSDVLSVPIATFEDLLHAIRQRLGHSKKFLIVAHGSSSGLFMPIATGSKYPADDKILVPLADYASGASRTKEVLLDTWQVDGRSVRPFADQKHLDRVAELVRQVMTAGLEEVHFRACNVGAGEGLNALARVMGARQTSAPTSWYLLGWRATANLPLNSDGRQLQNQLNTIPFPRRVYTRDDCLIPAQQGSSGDEPAVALNAFWGSDHKPNFGQLHAMSQVAVEGWTRTYLENSRFYPYGQRAPGGGYKRGQKLVVFGLANLENSQNPVLFPGDGVQFLSKIAVRNR